MASIATVEIALCQEDRALLRDFIAAATRSSASALSTVSTPPAQQPPAQNSAESSCSAAPDSAKGERAASSTDKPASAAKPKSAPAETPPASSPAAGTSAEQPASGLTVKDIQGVVMELVQIGGDAKKEAAAILAKFNAKQATQVRVTDYPAAHAELTALRDKHKAAK